MSAVLYYALASINVFVAVQCLTMDETERRRPMSNIIAAAFFVVMAVHFISMAVSS